MPRRPSGAHRPDTASGIGATSDRPRHRYRRVTEAPDLAAPVAGWRLWLLEPHAIGTRLVSPVARSVWAHRAATTATCRHGCARPPHDDCQCGLYAMDDLARLLETAIFWGPLAVGCTALWGRAVEHTHGWRGEHGYPLVLFVLPYPPRSFLSPLAVRMLARHMGRLGIVPTERRLSGVLAADDGLDEAYRHSLGDSYGVPVHLTPSPHLWTGPTPGVAHHAATVRDEAASGLAARRWGDRAAALRFTRAVDDLLVALQGPDPT